MVAQTGVCTSKRQPFVDRPGTMQSCRGPQASHAAQTKHRTPLFHSLASVNPNIAHGHRISRTTACSSSCSSSTSSSSMTSAVCAPPSVSWMSSSSTRCLYETLTCTCHRMQACRCSRSGQHRASVIAVAAASSTPGQQQPAAAAASQPDLSSIRKGDDIERLLFMQMVSCCSNEQIEQMCPCSILGVDLLLQDAPGKGGLFEAYYCSS